MKLPSLSFHRVNEETAVIDSLIAASEKSIKKIEERIVYLHSLKDSMDNLKKVQDQHKAIIDYLIKITSADEENEESLNDMINQIKREVNK